LARHRIGEHDAVFRSAGFLQSGESCPPELVTVLGDRGIDARSHRSYQLDSASLEASDLVLTMETRHVQKASMIEPDAFERIVPIREAAEVVQRLGGGPVQVEDFLVELNDGRDPRNYLGARWDVDDPYGRRIRAYRKAVDEIDELVGAVVGLLY
jgi:protein-tyrosine-phosphatase